MKSKILDKMSGTHTTQDLDEKDQVEGIFLFVKEKLDMIAVPFNFT